MVGLPQGLALHSYLEGNFAHPIKKSMILNFLPPKFEKQQDSSRSVSGYHHSRVSLLKVHLFRASLYQTLLPYPLDKQSVSEGKIGLFLLDQ